MSQLLIVTTAEKTYLGFKNAADGYEEKPIEDKSILTFLKAYLPGEQIHFTPHADQINALLSDDLKLDTPLLNMVLYVEGGTPPVIHSFIKNTASEIDYRYIDSNLPLRLFSNGRASDDFISHPEFTAGMGCVLPSNGFFEFKTQGGARCSQAVDICFDHHTQHALKLFLRRVLKETTPMDHLPIQVEHCITSNSISPYHEHGLSPRMLHVDPQRNPNYPYPARFGSHLLTEQDLKNLVRKKFNRMTFLERDIGYVIFNPPFGRDYMVDVLEARPTMRYRDVFDGMIDHYNTRVRDRLTFFRSPVITVPEELSYWALFFNLDKYPQSFKSDKEIELMTQMLWLNDRAGYTLLERCIRIMRQKTLTTMLLLLTPDDLEKAMMKKNALGEPLLFAVLNRAESVIQKSLSLKTLPERISLLHVKNKHHQSLLEMCLYRRDIIKALLLDEPIVDLLPNLLTTASDLRDFLKTLSQTDINRLFPRLQTRIIPLIDSRVSLVLVLQYLPVEHQRQLCRAMFDDFPRWLCTRSDITSVYQLLQIEDRGILLDSLNRDKKLGSLVNTRYDFKKLLDQTPTSHHLLILEAITLEKRWELLVLSTIHLKTILASIPKPLRQYPAIVALKQLYLLEPAKSLVSFKIKKALPSGEALAQRLKKETREANSPETVSREGPTPS